jgi:hypothetical protein
MNNETLTKAICNKGFSGHSSILPRSNFGVGGQETTPQSLTAYSLNRYKQGKNSRIKFLPCYLSLQPARFFTDENRYFCYQCFYIG